MYSFSLLTTALLSTLLTTSLAKSPEPISGFHLTWSEDFSGTDISSSKWGRYTGVSPNGEQQTYLPTGPNCRVLPTNSEGTGSSFLITPQKTNGQWTSCRVETKQAFQARAGGQIIIQARLKLGQPGAKLQGIWPAFWALGDSMRHGTQWPGCGEIDTFENISGGSLGYGTLHCGPACHDTSGLSQGIEFEYGAFHTWAHAIDLRSEDWRQQSITWYMDGRAYHVVKGADVNDENAWKAVAQKPMYMTLNVAVGGAWPGNAAGDTVDGAAAGMEVLYVGVYEA